MEHEKDELIEPQDLAVAVTEEKNENGVVAARHFKLPVCGKSVRIRRAKARDITAANDYAAKKGNSQSAAGLFLTHRLCEFDGKLLPIEDIEEMDLQDFTVLQQVASAFMQPYTVKILPS